MSDGRIPACPVCARAGRMRERWVSDGGWPVKACTGWNAPGIIA